jgi:hypothetical protein
VKNWFRSNSFFALGILIAAISLFVGFYSTGFGHGDYVAARLILPFACVVTGGYLGAGLVVSIVALIQWPTYGLSVDKSSRRVWVVVAIVIAHAALCWWLFTKGSENFR